MDELRKGFHQQLDDVRTELVRLAASVIEAIPRATAVILNGDLEGADALIQFDDEIDSLSLELEERCYQILALQAPVAGDLRQVVSVVKMIAEIERSADLAVNICKAARRIYGHDLDPRLRGLIARMGEQAEQLWESALESFEENDAAKAAAIDDMDSYLDSLQRKNLITAFFKFQRQRINFIVEPNQGISTFEIAVENHCCRTRNGFNNRRSQPHKFSAHAVKLLVKTFAKFVHNSP